MATEIYEIRLYTEDKTQVDISSDITKNLNEKYGTALSLCSLKDGSIQIVCKNGCHADSVRANLRTEMSIKKLIKFFLEYSEKCGKAFVGSVLYSTYCGKEGDVHGIIYINKNEGINYTFYADLVTDETGHGHLCHVPTVTVVTL
jgi:hypothetical protein